MIPPDFDYVAPDSLDAAVRALADAGEDAKPLAGGHSLLPLMKLRLAAPTLLVDLRHVGMRSIEREDGGWRIGAMTRHADLQVRREDLGVVAHAAGLIADQQVRNRGTIGGTLAHGDSASDLPAVLVATEGSVTVRGPSADGVATREIAAEDLFQDYLTTAIAPGEILTDVHLPALDGWSYAYEKFTRRAEDWAMVGVCALVRRADDGTCADVRVAFTNMGPTPLRAPAVEQALRGAPLDAASIARAAEHAGEGTDPPADLNASAEYKRHLARVLTGRALRRAAAV
jgi:carbon-monoxide dehydrogenase medium subunit